MVLALPSNRKSRSACDIRLTEFRTCMRVNASMDVSVPISGVKPGLGPMTQASDSSDTAGWGSSATPESPVASTTPAFRKLRRRDKHSAGITGKSPFLEFSNGGEVESQKNVRSMLLGKNSGGQELSTFRIGAPQ